MPKLPASDGQGKERRISCFWGDWATSKRIRRATCIAQPRSEGPIWFLNLQGTYEVWVRSGMHELLLLLTVSSAWAYLQADEQCTGFGKLFWVTSITSHSCLEGSPFQVPTTVKLHVLSQIDKWDKGKAVSERSASLQRDEEHKTLTKQPGKMTVCGMAVKGFWRGDAQCSHCVVGVFITNEQFTSKEGATSSTS